MKAAVHGRFVGPLVDDPCQLRYAYDSACVSLHIERSQWLFPAVLVLDNVSKSYADKLVVQPVTWTVAAGKTYVLIGPSGCGKSTLLRLMMGLVQPDE